MSLIISHHIYSSLMGLDVKCDAINDATDAPYGFWKNVWVEGRRRR